MTDEQWKLYQALSSVMLQAPETLTGEQKTAVALHIAQVALTGKTAIAVEPQSPEYQVSPDGTTKHRVSQAT